MSQKKQLKINRKKREKGGKEQAELKEKVAVKVAGTTEKKKDKQEVEERIKEREKLREEKAINRQRVAGLF